MKIQIKNRFNDSVLFEYESEKNSIKKTVEQAVNAGANLRGANLRGADLRGADLRGANLRCANLSGADLVGANLRCANLSGADLRGADLRDANLSGANLSGANLRGADLRDADLSGVDLMGAYLSGADLSGANLSGANLSGAKDIPYIPIACPSHGAFIGWKKVGVCIIELEIPEDAKRSSATTRKCRCDKAKVISITNIKGDESLTQIVNNNYTITTYRVGDMVFPDSYDENRWNECSHGIHFFINKQDAIDY